MVYYLIKVLYHKENEERYVKEDKALHRLAELQRRSIQIAPTNLEYRPNPFNKGMLVYLQ